MRKGNLSGVLAAFNNLANPTLRMLGHKNIARHGRAEPSPGRSPWPRAEAPPTREGRGATATSTGVPSPSAACRHPRNAIEAPSQPPIRSAIVPVCMVASDFGTLLSLQHPVLGRVPVSL